MKTNNTNNMEIKQGDKVRVSKDAPKIYLMGWYGFTCNVIDIEDCHAKIECNDCVLVLPCKYLIKVDEEAKEARFKVGDKVKVNLPRSIRHNTIGTVVFAYASGNAVNVDFGDDNEPIHCDCDCLEPYTEPAEQTEAEKKPDVGSITIPVEVDLTDSYWDAYAADLAKEVALKLVNAENPDKIGEIAVKVAKAVVEGLKRK